MRNLEGLGEERAGFKPLDVAQTGNDHAQYLVFGQIVFPHL